MVQKRDGSGGMWMVLLGSLLAVCQEVIEGIFSALCLSMGHCSEGGL